MRLNLTCMLCVYGPRRWRPGLLERLRASGICPFPTSVAQKSIKVGLGIFDFCAISRPLISKDSISSPKFSCGCSSAERTLWCRDSKRWALGNYFPVQICYKFIMSKYKGDWDLGLCTFCVLAFADPLSDGKIWFFLRADRVFFRKSHLLSGSLFASTQKVHRPRSQSPLSSDIRTS